MKEYYYIVYHNEEFTKLNKNYNVGVTILKLYLQYKLFYYKDVIRSPDKNLDIKYHAFFPGKLSNVVIGNNNYQIIKDVFTKLRFE